MRDILTNPKYTGYMVWNRRATKSGGKVNPPEAWVWSDQPTHEPLVSRDTFEAAAQVAQVRRGSRTEPGPNTAHRHTRHGYLLRSYVHCGDCGHRMFGKTRHGHAYYSCYPAGNNADRLDRYPADHPKAVYVREDSLTDALDHVIATRVFGPDRMAFLRHALAQRPSRQRHVEAARVEALRQQIDDLTGRQDRLIAELETTDPVDRAFRDRLRRRFDTLETERSDKARQLTELEKTLASQPEPDVDLLEALPILKSINITEAPERLQRKLYEALQLQIHYDRPDHARFRLTLADDTVDALTRATTGTGVREPESRAHATAAPPGAPRSEP